MRVITTVLFILHRRRRFRRYRLMRVIITALFIVPFIVFGQRQQEVPIWLGVIYGELSQPKPDSILFKDFFDHEQFADTIPYYHLFMSTAAYKLKKYENAIFFSSQGIKKFMNRQSNEIGLLQQLYLIRGMSRLELNDFRFSIDDLYKSGSTSFDTSNYSFTILYPLYRKINGTKQLTINAPIFPFNKIDGLLSLLYANLVLANNNQSYNEFYLKKTITFTYVILDNKSRIKLDSSVKGIFFFYMGLLSKLHPKEFIETDCDLMRKSSEYGNSHAFQYLKDNCYGSSLV